MVTVALVNILGEQLRDRPDPRLDVTRDASARHHILLKLSLRAPKGNPMPRPSPHFAAHLMMFANSEAPAALDRAIDEIAQSGLAGVEIPLTAGLIDHAERVAQHAHDRGLEIVTSTVLPPGGDIGSHAADERNAGLRFLRRAIDSATAIGSSVLGGVIHQPSRVIPDDARTSQRRTRMVSSLKEAVTYACDKGVQLAVEPTSRFLTSEINTVQEALDLRGEVGDGLGLLLDTYHLAAEERDPIDAVIHGIPAAAFIQINESTRGIFGEGTINWRRFAEAINTSHYRGWLSFEAFPPSSAWARRSSSWRDVGCARDIVKSGLDVLTPLFEQAPQ